MIYYTVYKIRNKINGKVYIGTHKTEDLYDGYMGSGKYLKHAIEKHGVVSFEKIILHIFDNPEQMFAKEAELVNEDFLESENTYNLRVGGFGGFDYINKTISTEKKKKRARAGYDAVPNLSKLGNAKRRTLKTIPCVFCGVEFRQKQRVQKFCSMSHAAKYNKNRKNKL